MRYFALANGLRHDLAGDLTEAKARMVAETSLGLVVYQLVDHATYWASQAGQSDQQAITAQAKRQAIRDHAHSLVLADSPELAGNMEFLRLVWPMLDKSNTPPEITRARAINQYARQKIQMSPAELVGYDPAGDPGWPA